MSQQPPGPKSSKSPNKYQANSRQTLFQAEKVVAAHLQSLLKARRSNSLQSALNRVADKNVFSFLSLGRVTPSSVLGPVHPMPERPEDFPLSDIERSEYQALYKQEQNLSMEIEKLKNRRDQVRSRGDTLFKLANKVKEKIKTDRELFELQRKANPFPVQPNGDCKIDFSQWPTERLKQFVAYQKAKEEYERLHRQFSSPM